MEFIKSSQNKTISRIQRLIKSRAARRDEGLIFLDGVHLIEECLVHGWVTDFQIFIEDPVVSEEINSLIQRAPDATKITLVESHVFKKLTTTKTSQGIVAVARPKKILNGRRIKFALALQGIQDPGNLGSILRTAAAFDVDAVYLSPGTADAYSPKCLRGGMGAQFRVTIHENVDLSSIVDEFEGTVVGASIAGGEDLNSLDLTDSTLMLVGSEGAGLTDDILSKVDHCVSITLAKDVESLNVASATAILCYQMTLMA